MNAFASWFTPDVLRTLGLSLLHFLWQGAAIAALAAVGFAVSRKASARYAIGVFSLALMIAAPVVTFFVLHQSSTVFSASENAVAPAAVPVAHAVRAAAARAADVASRSNTVSINALTWFVELWFVGVILFSLRTAGGFFLIARLRRRDAKPLRSELLALCREMQNRLGIARAIRFCESLQLDAPAVVGWFKPVVLLPIAALTGLTELQLRAVIAHELAHIRRFDSFFNLFQVIGESLLFYHPAVWWLNKRIRTERENCCDDVALAVCGDPAEYARALAQMEEGRVAPSFAMAANRGPLASRVARLLGITEKGSTLRNAGVAFGVLCIAAALVAGNALFGLVRSASAHSPKAAQTSVTSYVKADGTIVITAPRPHLNVKTNAAAQTSVTTETNLNAHPVIAATPAPQAEPTPFTAAVPFVSFVFGQSQASNPNPNPTPKGQSYIDAMKAEGFNDLDADDLISMKVQGVTPQYIHEIRAEGLKPSVDELVGMKVQGITPEYIRQIRAMNFKVDADSIIGMKVQGITPEYVDAMRKLGFNPDADEIIGMKVQGITPEYVEGLRKLGFKPDADQVIGMKVQGITPEYVDSMRKLGFQPDADEIIGMKVQGVTPEYVQQLKDLGLSPNTDDVVSFKVQGINADYVQSIRATGLNPNADELVSLKVQGVTSDYIKSLQAAGFKPDADEVVGAKVMGITPQFIEMARSKGFKNLDLDKLIQLKNANILE